MANNFYRTAKLDPNNWDLMLDANNDLAIGVDKYAIAQDVASAILTFSTEIIYDATRGVDWKAIVSKTPTYGFIISQIKAEVMKIEVINDVVVHLDFDPVSRTLYGVVVCEDIFGNSMVINF